MTTRPRDERGEATTEMVLTVPVLMLFILTIIQFGLWYHANHVAEAAAQEGVRAARVESGSAEAGRAQAAELMADSAGSLVEATTVSAWRADGSARVEVTGTLRSLMPGLSLPIRASAESPIERFEADNR